MMPSNFSSGLLLVEMLKRLTVKKNEYCNDDKSDGTSPPWPTSVCTFIFRWNNWSALLHTLSYRPSRSHCCALLSSKLALSISSALLSNRLECIARRSVSKPGNNAQGIVRHVTCVLLLSPAQSRSPRLHRGRALKVIGPGARQRVLAADTRQSPPPLQI